MSMTTLIVVGFLTAAEFMYILKSLNETVFLTVLGYKAWADLIFGFGTTVYFATTGTISGVVIAAFAGIMFSLCLHCTAKLFGTRRRVKGKWVVSPPAWSIAKLKEKALGYTSCFSF